MPLILALRRQRQVDISELEASLVYRAGPAQPGLHRETLSHIYIIAVKVADRCLERWISG